MAASLLSLIFLALFSVHPTHADPRANVVARSCRNTRVHNSSRYTYTYWKMVAAMEADMIQNKFAFDVAGDPPDRLYLFSQCMADVSGKECRKCFSRMKTLLPSCFPATGGRVFADGCFIRAENNSFFEETVGPDDLKSCSERFDRSQKFNDIAREVVNEIAKEAPNYRGYALKHNTSLQGSSIYAMANCWKTMDRGMCSTCLADAAMVALSCLPSIESRVMNAGCFLRYSNYDFTNSPGKGNAIDVSLFYVAYALGAVAFCTLSIAIGFLVGRTAYESKNHQRNVKSNAQTEMEMDLSLSNRNLQFLPFKYSTLEKATDCFSKVHKLGQGGYGEVFKGTLPDGREIAIKRLFISGKGRTEEVYDEMDIISRAQHKNLVRLLGYCFTSIDSFLVYEFLANRSLDSILFDPEKKTELDWSKRFGIIIGIAEGLEYLHKDCQVRIIHRDIKASNILLDWRHRPKIADFGLAKFYLCDKSLISTAIAGTLGYMAPEYLAHGRLTEKVDVYSFGVLVLEIISSIRNSEFQPAETFEALVTSTLETLVINAWKRFQSNTMAEIIDASMKMEDVKEISRVIQVGLLCTQESPSLRPTMTRVIQTLKDKDIQLPVPSKPPFADECMELSISKGSSPRQPSCLSDLCTFHSFKNIDPERG